MTCHIWARRQENDILTTSATICKIKSHFLHISIIVVEQVQGGLKGVAQEGGNNLSQSCICCANKVDVRI
jgi:hypothetical protein